MQALHEGIRRLDFALIQRLVAPYYLHIDHRGLPHGRAEWMESLQRKPERLPATILVVHEPTIVNGTALVSGHVQRAGKVGPPGVAVADDVLGFVQTWLLADDLWVRVLARATDRTIQSAPLASPR